jgi:putative DNA primase/helicase
VIIKGTRNKEGALCKFNLQADIQKLQQTVEHIKRTRGQVQLISIDPITSYLGNQIDGKGNVELRHAIDPVGAEATAAAVLSVTHFAKSSKGVSALNRVIGSIAFTAAPRAAFEVLRDDLDDASRLFLPVKANLMSFGEAYGMRFHIEEVEIGKRDPTTNQMIRAPRVKWDERDTRSVDSVLNPVKTKEDGAATAEAKAFFKLELAEGPQLVRDIRKWADGAGITYATLRRAYDAIGVTSRKRTQPDGHGPYEWSLPPDVDGYCPEFADDDANADLFA